MLQHKTVIVLLTMYYLNCVKVWGLNFRSFFIYQEIGRQATAKTCQDGMFSAEERIAAIHIGEDVTNSVPCYCKLYTLPGEAISRINVKQQLVNAIQDSNNEWIFMYSILPSDWEISGYNGPIFEISSNAVHVQFGNISMTTQVAVAIEIAGGTTSIHIECQINQFTTVEPETTLTTIISQATNTMVIPGISNTESNNKITANDQQQNISMIPYELTTNSHIYETGSEMSLTVTAKPLHRYVNNTITQTTEILEKSVVKTPVNTIVIIVITGFTVGFLTSFSIVSAIIIRKWCNKKKNDHNNSKNIEYGTNGIQPIYATLDESYMICNAISNEVNSPSELSFDLYPRFGDIELRTGPMSAEERVIIPSSISESLPDIEKKLYRFEEIELHRHLPLYSSCSCSHINPLFASFCDDKDISSITEMPTVIL